MNQLRKHTTLIFLLLLVSFSYGTTEDEQQLELEIGLSKRTVLLNEPIWLDATLTNVSADTVRIIGLCLPCQILFHIELKDGQGNVVPYAGPVYDMVPGKGWTIEPQEHYYGCFNLLEFFHSWKRKGLFNAIFLRFLSPGKYKACARYGNTYSQEIEFEVVEPIGDEKEVYQLFHEAFGFLRHNKLDSMKQKLQELINQFPNSVYAERVHKELLQRNELLQRFPNSRYNELSLRMLTSELAPEEKGEFLEKVIRDNPESRSAKFARQMLKWLEE